MTTKRQQVLTAIIQAGENGISSEDILKVVDIERHRLNVELWQFRNDGKIQSMRVSNISMHVAAGVSLEKVKATLEAELAAIRERQRQSRLEWFKQDRINKAAERAGKPLSEAQLAQKRAAAEKGRQRQKELGITPPKPQKKPRLMQVKTQSINKLAERVKKERPSMTVESKKVEVSIDWSKAKRIECPSPPPRFEVQVVRGLFRSLGPGRYAAEPASCAARAAA